MREPSFYVPTDRGVDMADGIIVSSAHKLFAIQVAMRKKNTIVRAGMKELGEKFKKIDLIFVIRERHFKNAKVAIPKENKQKGNRKKTKFDFGYYVKADEIKKYFLSCP